MKPGNDQQNRWDYLLGHGAQDVVVGLEPHCAKDGEISTVIAKRRAALDQLRSHLRNGAKISAWYWVASGTVHFADTEKARRMLDQNGVQFVGKCLKATNLPVSSKGAAGARGAARR